MPEPEEFRPVRDLLHPDDTDSHVNEAIARIEDNRALEEDQNNYPAIGQALRLLDLGFKVLPVRTNEKAPSSQNWEQATQNYPQRFLRNPGTRNYGILPPEGCVILDVDKDAGPFMAELTETLGILPETRRHHSPHGEHWVFRWPEHYPRPLGAWWGKVVARWPLGDRQQGYVVGPGSTIKDVDGSTKAYSVLWEADIATLPDMWAESVLAYRPPRDLSGVFGDDEAGDGYVLPERVEEGGRYEAIVRYTAHLYNRGFNRDEMWAAVRDILAPRFVAPLTERELRERFARATARDMESRLGPRTSVPLPPQPVGELFASPALSTPVLPSVHDVSTERPPEAGTGERNGLDEASHPQGQEPRHPAPEDAPKPNVAATPAWAEFFEPADALRSRLALLPPDTYLVDGLMVAGGLNVIGGHPKSGKSLALMQMMSAFVVSADVLGRKTLGPETVNVGLYVTRESPRKVMQARLDTLDRAVPGLGDSKRWRVAFLKALDFGNADLQRMAGYLADFHEYLRIRYPGRAQQVWLALDPIRDFMPAGTDEQEAKGMAVVKAWCRALLEAFDFLTITLVHHLRKSADGKSENLTGLELAGSGALYGMVDATMMWGATKATKVVTTTQGLFEVERDLRGAYNVESRGDAPVYGRWRLDEDTGLLVPDLDRRTGPGGQAMAGETTSPLLTLLQRRGTEGLTATEARDLLPDLSREAVRGGLNRLVGTGHATTVREGLANRYFIVGRNPSSDPEGLLPPDDESDIDYLPTH